MNISRLAIVVGVLLAIQPIAAAMENRIEGQVLDQDRQPVFNAFVELHNEVNAMMGRSRTSSQGRFSFSGMDPGHYSIKVLPLNTNLMSETKEIEINNQSSRSDLVIVEFILRPDKRFVKETASSRPQTLYAQDVPESARKLYRSGIEKSADHKGSLADIEAAIHEFPAYFEALSYLGQEYIDRGQFEKGYPFLLRAIDINQRCGSCYYGLGYAFYQLKNQAAALKAVDAAAILEPQSPSVHLLRGTLLRIDGNFIESEKALLKSKSLSAKPVAEVYWQLSLLYNRQRRNREAADQLETFLKIRPDYPERRQIEELIHKLKLSS